MKLSNDIVEALRTVIELPEHITSLKIEIGLDELPRLYTDSIPYSIKSKDDK